MVRKTDAEILAEIRKQELENADKEAKAIKAAIEVDEEEDKEQKTQVIEREITLSLINDKLNYIISNMSK